jgi:DMSO/TMAO reductase YedYZ heme-binding membrane subunit
MNEKLWWYVARSGGLMAWWTVSASVLWGLLLSTRVMARRSSPAWLLGLHRFLGGLSVTFTAIHLGALVADSYSHFGWSELFVPLASRWHPVAVAWGVVGFYLLVAIEVTSLLMRRLPKRWWRAVHSTSFAVFLLATVHAASAGTDGSNKAVQWSGLVICTLFTFLVLYRRFRPDPRQHRPLVKAAGNTGPRSGRRIPVPPPPAGSSASG